MHSEQEQQVRMKIAERIKTARKLRDWTQMELAENTGIPQSQISRLERGLIEEPGIFQLQRLANSFNIQMNELWSGEMAHFKHKVRGPGIQIDLTGAK